MQVLMKTFLYGAMPLALLLSCMCKRVIMNYREAGFCGDYCGKCPNYSDKCSGCIPSLHEDCYFVKCCLEKGIEHCGFCNDFPCKKLSEFVPDDRSECPPGFHIENLRVRKVVGTEEWLESQRAKWKNQ